MIWIFWPNRDSGPYLQSAGYDFSDFRGKRLPPNWSSPEIDVVRRRAKRRDFVSWSLSAPVVSEFAKECLDPVVGQNAEFVFLLSIGRTKYYAMNVVRTANCLDLRKSSVWFSKSEPHKILDIRSYAWLTEEIPDAQVFKCAEFPRDVFVQNGFVDTVIASGLTGAGFADPLIEPLARTMRGLSVNTVEGLPK